MERTPASERGLAWQCRRGMRELDVLLTAWLDTRYAAADDARKAAFRELLALPDPELCGYILGDMLPADPVAADVVRQIRHPAPT